ncbi:ATP-binding cassette domain-containing protein [Rhizobium sp. BK251]|uniref:amino acid ABC transporter ATP-binding/permease protein n=1 Tax=Rhizobium sp. BK251 TaxID=2512125 RepID=UPI00104A0735|nr:ATP-binding cassette domain-containing protein [Rhizobium sp. BK251]TCL72262.1 ATP-binding cassette subfamily C protein CydC [Rhizobium sp. BK251]
MRRLAKDLGSICRLFWAESRRALVMGACLSVATVIAGIALLGLSGWFITATAIAGLSLATAAVFDVFAPSAGIRFLAILRTAARYGERLTTHDATLQVLAALRERLFRGWAEPAAARSLLRRPAKLLFRLTADIDALDSLYLRVLVPCVAALLAALCTSLALGLMHPLLGAAIGGILVLAGIGIPLAAARYAERPARRRAHAIEALRARTIDLVSGQTELAMTGRLHAQRVSIGTADRCLAEADDALNRIEVGVNAAFALVTVLLLTAALIALAALSEAGTITAPVAALGLLVTFAAVEPFAALRRGALELGRTALAARRVGPRLRQSQPAPAPALPPKALAFDLVRVDARHEGAAHCCLRDISLSLAKGEILALAGPSGTGKSSLLALLAGEISHEAGMIETVPATLLTQRTELFQDSVRDNLRLADPLAGDGRLREALAAAGLLADIEALPLGLDSRLGEGGLGLSGGQARRLALARLLLSNSGLWLLDEPTDGLDGTTARDVVNRLLAQAEGRTLVIATHTRREAAIADHLAIMSQGRIIATLDRGDPKFEEALAGLRPD